MNFTKAQEAFEFYYDYIVESGIKYNDTLTLFNIGFYIQNPLDNNINTKWRNWNNEYAKYEWEWYLSGNQNATEISKRAPIWKNHMDESGLVQSNYGWQWVRNSQLDRIIDKLYASKIQKNYTRQAVITFYDGKEISNYGYDTPCTLSIHFQIVENKLCMTVNMRSNDLWFGFCNDQYCFSKLQEMVAKDIELEVGWYYHFSSNLHLYNDFINKKTNENRNS